MGSKHLERRQNIAEMPRNEVENHPQEPGSLVISTNPIGGEDTFTTAYHMVSDDITSPIKSCTPEQPDVLTKVHALRYAMVKREYERLVYTDSHEIIYPC